MTLVKNTDPDLILEITSQDRLHQSDHLQGQEIPDTLDLDHTHNKKQTQHHSTANIK